MYRKFGSSVRKTAKILTSSKRNTEKGEKISKSTVQNHLKTKFLGKKTFKSSKKSTGQEEIWRFFGKKWIFDFRNTW